MVVGQCGAGLPERCDELISPVLANTARAADEHCVNGCWENLFSLVVGCV
jgi:hypothetical protein